MEKAIGFAEFLAVMGVTGTVIMTLIYCWLCMLHDAKNNDF